MISLNRVKTQPPKAEPRPKRVSALDAAATVLRQAGKPMRARGLITAMTEQKLWSSPNGKTPHATLYAAMLREISSKGAAAGFKKVERGQFAPRHSSFARYGPSTKKKSHCTTPGLTITAA